MEGSPRGFPAHRKRVRPFDRGTRQTLIRKPGRQELSVVFQSTCLVRACSRLLLKFTNAFPNRWRGPSNRLVNGGINGEPSTANVYLRINMRVGVRFIGPETG